MKTVTEKDQFHATLERESPITLKVMRAFPAGRMDFKPAEKSKTAAELMWMFVLELGVIDGALAGTIDMAASQAPAPTSHAEIIAAYEKKVKEVMSKVASATDEQLSRLVKMPVGPKQMGDVPALQVLWIMLMDSVHHRGQLSVYIRMAGGKVPSIYGPSADEPWT